MRSVLIIGIGNTLRRDDGVGIVAAQKVGNAAGNIQLRIICCQQLTPDLAKDVTEADRVIMIDADQENAPGQVTVREIKPENRVWNTFTHDLQPEMLLLCAKELYGKTPDAFLVTGTGESFGFGEGLSQLAASTIPQILRHVIDLTQIE
jgi:hydrogenase maturation protease